MQFRPRWLIWSIGAPTLVAVAGAVAIHHFAYGKVEYPSSVSQPRSVAVARVVRADLSEDLVVEAEFRPYQEIDLHAKVGGYLDKIDVDIGDRVKADQVLAVLEVPELQNELGYAKAVESRCQEEIKRAQADYEEVHLAYTRLAAVDKSQPRLIAQQELDTARAKDSKAAAVVAVSIQQLRVAQADIKKVQTLLNFAKITAPFNGVITKRYADPGALIQAGTSSHTQTLPLVRLSELDRLRLVFPVTESFAARVQTGSPVEIRTAVLDKPLVARVSRITRRLETSTRTMDVEVDIENRDLRIFPGMYATVDLKLEQRKGVLALPLEAITDRASPTVFLINRERRIEERPVRLGLESPRQIQILEGLRENDVVVFGSRAQLEPGEVVEPRPVEPVRVN